jgi:hypothetical protein
MAASINGIGTRFYGASSPRPDGSVITTKWFAIVFIPIIPLSSFRVLRETKNDKFLILGYSSAYSIIEKLPIQWGQVLRTYGFCLGFLLWCFGLTAFKINLLPDWHPATWMQWLFLIGVVPIPFYLLMAYRALERKRLRQNMEETEQVVTH